MAKKDIQMEDEIIDLTELIEPGDKPAQPSARVAADDALGGDDFAAILAETTAAPARKVDPNEELDMSDMGGIDNLLESLDIPPQPRERAADGAPAAQGASDDELDNVLDDLLGGGDTAASGAEPPAAAKAAPPADAPKAAAANAPDLDADLDDILSSFDAPGDAQKAGAQPAAKAQPAHDDLLNADLDDILADMEAPKKAEPAASSPAAAPAGDDLDALLGGTAPKAAPPPPPDLDDDLDALLNEAPSRPAPDSVSAAGPGASPDDDLDSLLGASSPKATPPPKAAPRPASKPAQAPPSLDDELEDILNEPAPKPVETRLSGSPASLDDLDDILNEAPSAPVAAPASRVSSVPSGAPDQSLPAETRDAQTSTQPVPVQTWTPDALVSLCRNMSTGQNTQETLQDFSRELGAQTAHVEDMGEQMAQLGKRLLACESKLAAARSRIAVLEKSFESTVALEDLLKEGTPLHAGFMALIASAVGNALKGVNIADNTAELRADMEKLRADLRDVSSRVTELEKHAAEASDDSGLKSDMEKLDANAWSADMRIEKLERRVAELGDSGAMEKAAASAVARVLHEEISRLAQG